ncbi:MAG: rod shape-determining protein RodA [Chloroflexi bacterium]|nr:rod shape-determining protein RodA [Chloroflexota bacterium]
MYVWRRFDWILFLLMFALVAIGLLMINSAYQAPAGDGALDWTENLVLRQVLFFGIGLVSYLVLAAVDYRVLIVHARWVFAAALAMLVITLIIASPIFGTSAWLEVGVFGIQPSELSKVLVIVVLARILGESQRRLETPLPLVQAIAALAVPGVLVYQQSDLGMVMLLAIAWVGMVFVAGVRWRHLVGLGALAASAVPVVWFRLEDYMRGRVMEFVNPNQDPLGSSYNINQALISIGSGGWWGKGYMQGSQSQLRFLRVRHTDFIFSVLCEEFGFVGALVLILLFALLFLRMIRIAERAPDGPGRLIVYGVTILLVSQTLINIGVNVNLLPVTGLALPMVSYGGSSLVTSMIALGLVQSVAMRISQDDNALL